MAFNQEVRFLTHCLPTDSVHRLDLTQDLPELDWAALLEIAKWHGMAPLLTAHLPLSENASILQLKISETTLAALRTYRMRHLFRSITQMAALVELQREFDRHNLPIVSWKGPSVGALLYGSATLRESVDLDFLFLAEHIQPILEITRGLGYDLLASTGSESKDLYLLALHGEFTFGRKKDQLFLEFHLQVLPSRFYLWQDSRIDVMRASTICPVAGVALLMQTPEDLLVSLCAHATKHYWERMKWSCDIAQFLKVYSHQLDWSELLGKLRKTRKDSVVLLGLALAAELFSLELPPAVASALLKKPNIVALSSELASRIMSGSSETTPAPLQSAMVALLCPRLRDRLAYILRPFVELNFEDLHVPVHNRAFFFLNYIFRAFRVLRKYGPHRVALKTAGTVRSVR